MGFFNLVFRKTRISLEQQGTDLVSPNQVHNLFMRQDGIRRRSTATHEHNEQKRHGMATKQAAPIGHGAWRYWQVTHKFKSGREARE